MPGCFGCDSDDEKLSSSQPYVEIERTNNTGGNASSSKARVSSGTASSNPYVMLTAASSTQASRKPATAPQQQSMNRKAVPPQQSAKQQPAAAAKQPTVDDSGFKQLYNLSYELSSDVALNTLYRPKIWTCALKEEVSTEVKRIMSECNNKLKESKAQLTRFRLDLVSIQNNEGVARLLIEKNAYHTDTELAFYQDTLTWWETFLDKCGTLAGLIMSLKKQEEAFIGRLTHLNDLIQKPAQAKLANKKDEIRQQVVGENTRFQAYSEKLADYKKTYDEIDSKNQEFSKRKDELIANLTPKPPATAPGSVETSAAPVVVPSSVSTAPNSVLLKPIAVAQQAQQLPAPSAPKLPGAGPVF